MKINKAPGPNFKSKQQKSIEPNLPLLFCLSRAGLMAVCCLVMLSLLLGGEEDQGRGSHLLIVTGRGWTPARKGAIISLRCNYCQNFNTATKSILQGQKEPK